MNSMFSKSGAFWALHRGLSQSLRPLGVRFEVRETGPERIGLWRMSLGGLTPKRNGRWLRKLVLIPGLGDTPLSWMPIFFGIRYILKKEYDEVVIIDFPGFSGNLSMDPPPEDFEQVLRTLRSVLVELRPKTLVGHSLGGWFASLLAADKDRRIRIEKLLLFAPSGLLLESYDQTRFRGEFEELLCGGFRHLKPHVFYKQPFWFRFIESQFENLMQLNSWKPLFDSVQPHHLLNSVLHRFTPEVTLVWGKKDTLIPVEHMKDWEKILSTQGQTGSTNLFRKILLEDCGHSPQIERPVATAVILSSLVSGLENAPALLPRKWVHSEEPQNKHWSTLLDLAQNFSKKSAIPRVDGF